MKHFFAVSLLLLSTACFKVPISFNLSEQKIDVGDAVNAFGDRLASVCEKIPAGVNLTDCSELLLLHLVDDNCQLPDKIPAQVAGTDYAPNGTCSDQDIQSWLTSTYLKDLNIATAVEVSNDMKLPDACQEALKEKDKVIPTMTIKVLENSLNTDIPGLSLYVAMKDFDHDKTTAEDIKRLAADGTLVLIASSDKVSAGSEEDLTINPNISPQVLEKLFQTEFTIVVLPNTLELTKEGDSLVKPDGILRIQPKIDLLVNVNIFEDLDCGADLLKQT